MATTFPAQFVSAPVGYSYGYDNVVPPFYLGGVQLTAAAASMSIGPVAAFNTYELRGFITGFSASDLAALQFNGDTGANYWDRNVTVAQGATLNTNTETASTTQIRLGIAGTKGVFFRAFIGNFATLTKVVNGSVSLGSGAAATVMAAVTSCAGEWINTTAQITTVTVKVVGANNFLAGSSIQLFGGV